MRQRRFNGVSPYRACVNGVLMEFRLIVNASTSIVVASKYMSSASTWPLVLDTPLLTEWLATPLSD